MLDSSLQCFGVCVKDARLFRSYWILAWFSLWQAKIIDSQTSLPLIGYQFAPALFCAQAKRQNGHLDEFLTHFLTGIIQVKLWLGLFELSTGKPSVRSKHSNLTKTQAVFITVLLLYHKEFSWGGGVKYQHVCLFFFTQVKSALQLAVELSVLITSLGKTPNTLLTCTQSLNWQTSWTLLSSGALTWTSIKRWIWPEGWLSFGIHLVYLLPKRRVLCCCCCRFRIKSCSASATSCAFGTVESQARSASSSPPRFKVDFWHPCSSALRRQKKKKKMFVGNFPWMMEDLIASSPAEQL